MPSPIFIPFGPFEPDAAVVNSGVVSTASFVYPARVGYTFIPAEAVISTVIPVGPLTAGVVIQTSPAGAYSLYYGTTNILRRIDSSNLNSATTIATSTQPTAPALWRFAKFGTKLIAVHSGVDPLYEDWTAAAAAMSTLGGSPPRASGVFTAGDFVFLTGLASNGRKLQWSAINNPEGWTVGTNLSDEQEFPDGDDIFGITGDKSGYVVQQNAIRTFQFLPGDTTTIFEFNKVPDVPGCAGRNAWATVGQSIFYYSEEGFCSLGPGGFRRIGAHRVDSYFKAKTQNIRYVKAVPDPYSPRIYFSYDEGIGTASGSLVYDWLLDKWSEMLTVPSFWFNHIEATGGGAQIAFTGGSISNLTGQQNGASITTAVTELIKGSRAIATEARPEVFGNISNVQVHVGEKIKDVTNVATITTQGANGRFSLNQSGNYHAFTISPTATSAANNTKYLLGLWVWASPAGEA